MSTSSPTCFRRSSITDDKKSGLSGVDDSPNLFAESVWREASGEYPFRGWPFFGATRKSGMTPSKIFLRSSSMEGRSEISSEEGGSADASASLFWAWRKTDWMICMPISGQLSFSASMGSESVFGALPFVPLCGGLSGETCLPSCASLVATRAEPLSETMSSLNFFGAFCEASGDCGSSIFSPRERNAMIHCTRKSGLFFAVRDWTTPVGNDLERRVIGGERPSGCSTHDWG